MGEGQEFLTVAEVATRLKLTEDTIRRWCQSGKLNSILLSRRAGYRIPVSEVERLLNVKHDEQAINSSTDYRDNSQSQDRNRELG